MYCLSSHATLPEFIWNRVPYPRATACLCATQNNPDCSLKFRCTDFFVSQTNFQHKLASGPVREECYAGLFWKTGLCTSDQVGRIKYSYTPGRSGYISNVLLQEEWRGKGLGKVLMQHALREMDKVEIERVTLDVAPWNKPAIALYRKYGFIFGNRFLDCSITMLRTLPRKVKDS